MVFKDLLNIFFWGILLPLAGSMLSIFLLNDWKFPHEILHLFVESVGTLIAIALFIVLNFSESTKKEFSERETYWISGAIVSMGVLDGFHAFSAIGNNFVWLHSIATFLGGGIFAAIVIRTQIANIRYVPVISLLLALSIGIASVAYPDLMPSMLEEGHFTITAKLINLAGGIGFIITSAYFYQRYTTTNKKFYLLLITHCLLFGMAGILFELSTLWDAAWWWWHLLRFLAYVVLILFFAPYVFRSIANKIILLLCLTMFGITLANGLLNYKHMNQIAMDSAIKSLRNDTRILSIQFKKHYDNLKKDVELLSLSSSIRGIIRAIDNKEKDPQTYHTIHEWRTKLNEVFSSLIEARPHYTQIRYIGIHDNGKEIARVNRNQDTIEIVTPERLQKKGNEPYFINTTHLAPDNVFFSEITYNHEYGIPDNEQIPTIRTILPVYNQGDLFGMIVINSDYRVLLQEVLKNSPQENNYFVVNSYGDYMEKDEGIIKKFHFHHHYNKRSPAFINEMRQLETSEAVIHNEHSINYYIRQSLSNSSLHEGYIGVMGRIRKDKVLAEANDAQRYNITFSFFFMIGAIFIASVVTVRFTRNLQQMTHTLSNPDNVYEVVLPTDQKDETSQLSTAFNNLMQKIKDGRTHINSILQHAIDGIITTNSEGIITAYNPACEAIFGYNNEEVIGQTINTIIPGAYNHKTKKFLENFNTNSNIDIPQLVSKIIEIQASHKNGTLFPVELSFSEILLEDGTYLYSCFVRDISAKKEQDKEREELIKALEYSNKELDQFAYVACHDLKAPLRVIDNSSKFLEEDLEEYLSKENRKDMNLLRNRVLRMEKLLDDLLTYSKVGREKVKQEIISGEDMIHDTILLLSPPENFTITVNNHFKSMQTNRMPLKQILHNLVNNAIKHHGKETGTINIVLEEGNSDYYAIKVIDDGVGIPAEFHEKVFKMFQTLKPRDQVEGSGMGLALILKIVQHIGAKIELSSEVGKGCCFTLWWPKELIELKDKDNDKKPQ